MKDLCFGEQNKFLKTHLFSLFDLLEQKVLIMWTNIPQNFDLKKSLKARMRLFTKLSRSFFRLPVSFQFVFISSKDLNTIRIIKITLKLKDSRLSFTWSAC